jgi:hypothetical protein
MCQVEIKSFYRLKSHKFVPVEDYKKPIKAFYVDGYILIKIKENVLLDERQWDLIDQLWHEIAKGISCLAHRTDFQAYFPDDPAWIRFKFEPDTTLVTVSVKSDIVREANEEADCLLLHFGNAAIFFFEHLIPLLRDEEKKECYLSRLDEVKSIMNQNKRRFAKYIRKGTVE